MTYKAGDQPDPDFVKFFAGDWQQLLERVVVPGMEKPSWDRRAAYLLWEMAKDMQSSDDALAEEGGAKRVSEPPLPINDYIALYYGIRQPVKIDNAPVGWTAHYAAAPVGKVGFALTMLDNHFGIDDCKPTPGGVKLAFDSSKHKW